MKDSTVKRWYWMTALGILIPCMLYSAEPTNQPPPTATVEKPKDVTVAKPLLPTTAAIPSGTRIDFKLPLRGAPAVRIDGGSRGSGVSLTCLTVLTPDSTALTTQEQPSLFWYQSQPADVPFELTLLANNVVQPALRVDFPNARAAGIQRLNLADHQFKLVPDVEYEWVIALVVDPQNRSKDVVASGWIKRVAPSMDLQSELGNTDARNAPSVYAQQGIWLDALTTLSSLIEAHPQDRSLQEERASLLEQVGLTNAARYAASQPAQP